MKFAKKKVADGFLFALLGPLDEKAADDLEALEAAAHDAGAVTLDLERTTHFNSIGLAAFVRFAERMRAKGALSFINCPMTFIRYMTMLGSTAKVRSSIASVKIPRVCGSCDKEFEIPGQRAHLLDGSALLPSACPACPSSGKGAEVTVSASEDLASFIEFLRKDG